MIERSAPPRLDSAILHRELRKTYARMALFPGRRYHLNTGRPLARTVGYDDAMLDTLPAASVDAFSGAGNPLGAAGPRAGEALLDVGCGAGMDLLIGARAVGPAGRAIGIDMTGVVVQVARASARRAAKWATAEVGMAEELAYPDASFDVAIANNVINNCCVDKVVALREMYRVLRPGGRLAMSDVVIERPIPDGGRADIGLWTC